MRVRRCNKSAATGGGHAMAPTQHMRISQKSEKVDQIVWLVLFAIHTALAPNLPHSNSETVNLLSIVLRIF